MSSGGSGEQPVETTEKAVTENLENIKTKEHVPGNPHYYEKNGLRTYGDGENHEVEPSVILGNALHQS